MSRMQMADNTIATAKKYIDNSLIELYSTSELEAIVSILFEDLLGISKEERILNPLHRLSESELLKIIYACKDLKIKKPVQYITGKVFFGDLFLKTDERALIPRPETEELVSIIINENCHVESIKDYCTGSGCIALSLKKHFSEARVLATDISANALSLAKENAIANELNVEFLEEDCLEAKAHGDFYSIIVSNPPYVLEKDKANMEENVLNYEPHSALFVPNDRALLFYEAIVKRAVKELKTGGRLYFEIHEDKSKEVVELLKEYKFSNIQVRKDLYDKDRFVSADFYVFNK